jgi:uncharacterized protein involved in type VI secretion and phage assembly
MKNEFGSEIMESNRRAFYGKYRGLVSDNNDPKMIGRIRAKVPAIFGESESGWALPCVPYAGNRVGLFFIPPIGANVWIEFEAGDSENPIWSGCFWATGEVPEKAISHETKVIQTEHASITIADKLGEISLRIETDLGLKIILDNSRIELSNSSSNIKLTSHSVSINDDAFEVI